MSALLLFFFKFKNLPRGMVEVGYFSLLAANFQNTTVIKLFFKKITNRSIKYLPRGLVEVNAAAPTIGPIDPEDRGRLTSEPF